MLCARRILTRDVLSLSSSLRGALEPRSPGVWINLRFSGARSRPTIDFDEKRVSYTWFGEIVNNLAQSIFKNDPFLLPTMKTSNERPICRGKRLAFPTSVAGSLV